MTFQNSEATLRNYFEFYCVHEKNNYTSKVCAHVQYISIIFSARQNHFKFLLLELKFLWLYIFATVNNKWFLIIMYKWLYFKYKTNVWPYCLLNESGVETTKCSAICKSAIYYTLNDIHHIQKAIIYSGLLS